MLMVSSPTFEEAIQLAREIPNLSVGIHLNATFGKAMSYEETAIRRLCDSQGNFLSRNIKKCSPTAWEAEFRRQIETFLSTGLTPVFLNTHRHLVSNKKVLHLLIKLAKEYKIKAVGRIPVKIARQEQVYTPDNYLFSHNYKPENLAPVLIKKIHHGTTELVIHPGHLTLERASFCSWATHRYRVFQTLMDPSFRATLDRKNIELICWEDVIPKPASVQSVEEPMDNPNLENGPRI
jgi:chitin disaccharide deacetylase